MMKKIIAIGSLLLSGVVLVATSIIAFGYWRMPNQVKNIGDWIILLPPVIAPAVSLLLAFVVLSNRVINKITNGLFVGALIGISIYMLIPALLLVFQFNQIAKDGTAYWAQLMMPVIFIGIPLLLVGAIIGLIVGLKEGKRTKTV